MPYRAEYNRQTIEEL